MKILVIGGTGFVGRHIVERAISLRHEVTIFNRGITNPGLFPEARKVSGDRATEMALVGNETWDAVIDVNGYTPAAVRASAQHFKAVADHYVFVSTASVYQFVEGVDCIQEDHPTVEQDASQDLRYWAEDYAPLKRTCEQIVSEQFPSKSTILRLAVVAGAHDPTDRATYWVWRSSQGGRMAAPGNPDWRLQFADVRDVAAFGIEAVGQKIFGTFNLAGPDFAWRDWLDACCSVTGGACELDWIEDPSKFLALHSPTGRPFGPAPLAQFRDPPFTLSIVKLISIKPEMRSPEDTAEYIWSWLRTRNLNSGAPPVDVDSCVRRVFDWGPGIPENGLIAGLTPDQEQALLALT